MSYSARQTSEPVFVLGSPRSATTLVRDCVASAGWRCFDEGHVFPLVADLTRSVDSYLFNHARENGRTAWTVDQINWAPLSAHILEYVENIHVSRLGARWLDKTPGPAMIRIAPQLVRLFPKAKFIFCSRHPLEVIESARSRFSEAPAKMADFWLEAMNAWSKVRPQLQYSYVEIDHFDLTSDPASVAEKLATFLGDRDNFQQPIFDIMTKTFPEQTSYGRSFKALKDMSWPESEKLAVNELIGTRIAAFGYSLDQPGRSEKRYRALPFSVDPKQVDRQNLLNNEYWKFIAADRFLLHPNDKAEKPSEVVYLNIDVDEINLVGAQLEVTHEQSMPVEFTMELLRDGEILGSETQIVSFGEVKGCFVPINVDGGRCDLVLRCKMTNEDDTNAFAWLNILNLSLYYK